MVRCQRTSGAERRVSKRIQQLRQLAAIGDAIPYKASLPAKVDVVLAGASSGTVRFDEVSSILSKVGIACCQMPSLQHRPSAATAARLMCAVNPSFEMASFLMTAQKREFVQDIGMLFDPDHVPDSHLGEALSDLHKTFAASCVWYASSAVWRYSGAWQGLTSRTWETTSENALHVLVSVVFTGLLAVQPHRFNHTCMSDVLWTDIDRDTRKWREVMNGLNDLLRDRSQPTWDPPPDHPLGRAIRELVPWKLERLQVVKMPKQRRFPTDVPWLHRGCVLLHVDETITLETESVSDHMFPRQRFSKPVALGIFFFGSALEQEQFQPQSEEQPKQARVRQPPIEYQQLQQKHLVRSREGISFSVDKNEITPDICHAVAKIHDSSMTGFRWTSSTSTT
eukprot:4564278-Amphidinium_carterae.1